MNNLYPLKFEPILLDKIWGGKKLRDVLKKSNAGESAGESWEISSVDGNISVVADGFLKGNNIQELIEVYMGDLIGDSVYEKFGLEFPLLIKFIDANDDLSIQVHPDDEIASERHGSFGKSEMWYVMQAEKGAKLISGFRKKVNKEQYIDSLNENKIPDLLKAEEVSEGDVFFIPAGRVHAIGSGILLAEIQQTSDVTYRIFDFNRKDKDGKTRDLHTDQALDVIDFTSKSSYKTQYEKAVNKSIELESCPYFTTNLMHFTTPVEKDYNFIDSFVILICTQGRVEIRYKENQKMMIEKGETVLLPAELKSINLTPTEESKLLEVYIK